MILFKRFLVSIFTLTIIYADAIEVSPSSLNFGNVLMGNTPTLTFTITSDLEQTITLQIPPYFETDIQSLILPQGESQDVNVTFSPPSVGNYDTAATSGDANTGGGGGGGGGKQASGAGGSGVVIVRYQYQGA